jgi:hypothetical protein
MRLQLEPVEMTPAVIQQLEDVGLIIRLAPGRLAPPVNNDEPTPVNVYITKPEYGPHKVIACALNTTEAIKNFNYHPDHEEFLLIGNPDCRPSFLVISRLFTPEFEAKARAGSLSAADFIALRMKFNDPQVSFFTMRPFVPHGEVTIPGNEPPATFFVTESSGLPVIKPELAGFTWDVLLR